MRLSPPPQVAGARTAPSAPARRGAVALRAAPVQRDAVAAPELSKALAAAALAAVVGFGAVEPARADISGLTPCSESKAYAKRLKNEVKALNKRLKNVRTRTMCTINGQIY